MNTVDPRETLRQSFAQRLTAARVRKRWSQSDLARQAAMHTENGTFGRALVSMYERGRQLPNPINLQALALALGIDSDELIPSMLPKMDEPTPQLETKDLGDGRVWLRINQATTWPVALEILNLLKSANPA